MLVYQRVDYNYSILLTIDESWDDPSSGNCQISCSSSSCQNRQLTCLEGVEPGFHPFLMVKSLPQKRDGLLLAILAPETIWAPPRS